MDIAYALYFIFPAYCANAVPVIFGGGRPIDAGRTFIDGKPILGSHKTVRGFFAGLIVGTLVGFVQNAVYPLYQSNLLLGFALSFGALIGDLLDSFVKRRLGFPPGASFPILDQLDFVVGALLFSLMVPPLPPLNLILIIIIITPPIHLLTNVLAFLISFKNTPW
ncbi:CDP-2,3-bis-(O-geranylgeranyl)-sn-glycerol synthase [Candidatus Bathyarchaeota archaeon]|nr:CDP-2,3-bis-(O-geranylgeranyl)-sn-glycerol synthase [Candidatus Bathyarchaeota archaeon]